MDAALVEIAKAVAQDLAQGHLVDANGVAIATSGNPPRLSQPLVVKRAYVPRFTPASMDVGQWQVIVSTDNEQPQRIGRGTIDVEYTVQIGVAGKVENVDDVDFLDDAMQLLQEIGDFFFDYGLSGPAATWVRNEVLAWPEREWLGKGDGFFALWNCVFEGARERLTR